MRIIKCQQGTPEWYEARAGKITASMFATARDKYKSGANKGQFKAAGKQYAFRIAIERLSGQLLNDDSFETYHMRRGHELEPEARARHEEHLKTFVDQTGFVVDDDDWFGASLDGLVGLKGSAEYKAFVAPEKLLPIMMEDDIGDVMDQVQGGLWITGRDWCDFCLYCPALESVGKDFKAIRFERDEAYIKELESDLLEFRGLVEFYMGKLAEDDAA